MTLSHFFFLPFSKDYLINATVPGGIYTDLEKAKVLKTPVYYRFNDEDYRWVAYENWTYQRYFEGKATTLYDDFS